MTVKHWTRWPSYSPEMGQLYHASFPRHKVLNLDTEGYKTPNVDALETVSRKQMPSYNLEHLLHLSLLQNS